MFWREVGKIQKYKHIIKEVVSTDYYLLLIPSFLKPGRSSPPAS